MTSKNMPELPPIRRRRERNSSKFLPSKKHEASNQLTERIYRGDNVRQRLIECGIADRVLRALERRRNLYQIPQNVHLNQDEVERGIIDLWIERTRRNGRIQTAIIVETPYVTGLRSTTSRGTINFAVDLTGAGAFGVPGEDEPLSAEQREAIIRTIKCSPEEL